MKPYAYVQRVNGASSGFICPVTDLNSSVLRRSDVKGMGNQLSQPQKLQPEHLAEVPKVVLKENLGKLIGGPLDTLCTEITYLYRVTTFAMYCKRLAVIKPNRLGDHAGGGRFFKTLQCLHDDGGLVVVKVTE